MSVGGYLRLRRADYDDTALIAWAERIRAQAWLDGFVFFKHDGIGKGPEMASRLLTLLGAVSRPTAQPTRAR